MARYTDFPGDYPFYGGRSLTWGVGIHQDVDATTGEKEYVRADYLNRVEHRVRRIEDVIQQIEHEILYPDGLLNASGVLSGRITESVPSSGEWYISSRIDRLASDVNTLLVYMGAATRFGYLASDFNALVAALDASGIIGPDVLSHYPESTTANLVPSGTTAYYPHHVGSA